MVLIRFTLPMNLLIADCGLRIADCVLRHGSWPVSRSERNRELSMNLVASGVSRITSPQREPSPREIRADSRRLLRFMVPMRGERPWRLPRLAVAHPTSEHGLTNR